MNAIKKFPVLAMSFLITAPVLAQEVVEIRMIPFEKKASNPVVYFCLEPSQIPDVYHGIEYSLMDMPMAVSESGGTMAVYFGRRGVYLTTTECLEQVKASAEALGIDVDNDLEYTYITP